MEIIQKCMVGQSGDQGHDKSSFNMLKETQDWLNFEVKN